jgi:lipid-A-disaccharide synthase
VWAWRQGRVRTIRDRVDKLFCLFPFEEPWFRERGVDATYIGHPLAATIRPNRSREEFLAAHKLDGARQIVVLLPGSRAGEARRHLPALLGAVEILRRRFPQLQVVLATPKTLQPRKAFASFWERFSALSIQVIEDEAWDCLAYASLALAASGTVTVEAAVLGTPLVTFYKVTPLSWWAGRRLVKVPYLSMVNLIAGRMLAPELMQDDMTDESIAAAATPLLEDPATADAMRQGLADVRQAISREGDPFERAAALVVRHWENALGRRAPAANR